MSAINSSSAANSANDSASTTSSNANSAASLQSTFLTLLVTQLQNQDPTNPMDSSQLTSQLAEINTVSGIAQLNQTLTSLQTQLTQNQQVSASTLLGKTVFAPGSNVQVSSGTPSTSGVNLSGAATDLTLTIKDKNGNTVRTIDEGAQPAGLSVNAWDGKDSNGNVVPDGTYTISATAASATSTAVTATTITLNTVTSVIQQPDGSVGLTLSDGDVVSLGSIVDILPAPPSAPASGTSSS
jgi:flagellar basal-body rod modification protein FlgD